MYLSEIKVKQFMQPLETLVSKETKIWKAWLVMKNSDSDFIGVEENSNLIGAVSFRDLQIASSLSGNERSEVFEVMELFNDSISPDASIEQAVEVMQNNKSHYVMVKQNGSAIGFFTCFDLIKAINSISSDKEVVQPA